MDEASDEENTKAHPLEKLQEKLELYLKELSVLGFNSGKYDINAAKNPFFAHLVKYEQVKFVIKRNYNHMCLETLHLKFLDITNYLAPGFSYDQFLKAYECTQTKGYFPYKWVDSLEKLEFPTLPPPEAFHSTLSGTDVTEEQYEYCQRVWNDNDMESFRDFLVWYNNLDVVPFLENIEKMSKFWKDRSIDIFKDGVSVPGLTMKYLFSNVPNTYFSLFSEKDKDLYYTMKDNNVGGPSIIFKDEKAMLYNQILQRYLNYYDKRMSQPVWVSVVPSKPTTDKTEVQAEPADMPGNVEADIIESVPPTMKSRARQLVRN